MRKKIEIAKIGTTPVPCRSLKRPCWSLKRPCRSLKRPCRSRVTFSPFSTPHRRQQTWIKQWTPSVRPSVRPSEKKQYRAKELSTKIDASKKTKLCYPRRYSFWKFEGIGPWVRFQIFCWSKLVGVAPGVYPKSVWSLSYDIFFPEIAKIWTTPVPCRSLKRVCRSHFLSVFWCPGSRKVWGSKIAQFRVTKKIKTQNQYLWWG